MSVFGVILVCIFPHSDWLPRDTKYLSTFSPNAVKCGPEKLWIRWSFFSQWLLLITLGGVFLNFFSIYHDLKNPLCVPTGSYIQSGDIPEKRLNKILQILRPMFYFWTTPEGFFIQGIDNKTLVQYGLRSCLIL